MVVAAESVVAESIVAAEIAAAAWVRGGLDSKFDAPRVAWLVQGMHCLAPDSV